MAYLSQNVVTRNNFDGKMLPRIVDTGYYLRTRSVKKKTEFFGKVTHSPPRPQANVNKRARHIYKHGNTEASMISVNSVETDGENIYITGADGCDRKYTPGERLNPKIIDLDPAVLGLTTKNLLPNGHLRDAACAITEETKKKYGSLMESVGLPVSEDGCLLPSAELNENLRSATFGCKMFPAEFVKTTLEKLWRAETNLCDLNINWRTKINQTQTMKRLKGGENCASIARVWSSSIHSESPFGMVNLEDNTVILKGNLNFKKDQVSIHAHFSKDEKRVSVLCLSDYSLSVICSRIFQTIGKAFEIPALKAAFSKVTNSDVFYELRYGQLQKLIKNSREIEIE